MRKLMIVAFLLVTAQGAHAQGMAGLKGGATWANLKIENIDSIQGRLLGWGGGFFMWFGRGPVSLQAELMAINKGARFNDPADAANNFKLKLNYVELPVTALIHLGSGPYLFAGPAVGIESSCMVETKDQQITTSNSCSNQGENIFRRRKIDFSGVVGGGFRYGIGKTGGRSILLEARQEWGFTNINKETGGAAIKNRAFSVFAGYATSLQARHR